MDVNVRKMKLKKIALVGEQKGSGLIETLVAIAVLGLIASAFLASISTGTIALSNVKEDVNAQSLARSQLEYTKSYTYNSTSSPLYPLNPNMTIPAGYSVEVLAAASTPDNGLQNITVKIKRDNELVLQIEDIKINRLL
jgi:type II secretory pathway pseudopilin PulG